MTSKEDQVRLRLLREKLEAVVTSTSRLKKESEELERIAGEREELLFTLDQEASRAMTFLEHADWSHAKIRSHFKAKKHWWQLRRRKIDRAHLEFKRWGITDYSQVLYMRSDGILYIGVYTPDYSGGWYVVLHRPSEVKGADNDTLRFWLKGIRDFIEDSETEQYISEHLKS